MNTNLFRQKTNSQQGALWECSYDTVAKLTDFKNTSTHICC